MRTKMGSIVVLLWLVVVLPAMAQQMDTKTSASLMDQGFKALKNGDVATTIRCHYKVATEDPYSRNGGVANATLGDHCLKRGQVAEAKAWYKRSLWSCDKEIVAQGHQRLAGLAVRSKDMNAAAKEFLAAGDNNPEIASEMNYKVAKCYISLAQANPKQREQSKLLAERYLALSGSEKALTELFGIRYERIKDAEVRAKDPTDIFYASHPLKDNWLTWMDNALASEAVMTDPEAKATLQLMIAEVYFDSLNDLEKAKAKTKEIDLKQRKQAAWGRLVCAGCLQDQGLYAEAAKTFRSIQIDFTDTDNFDRNDVRSLAGRLAKICDRKGAKK